MPRRVIPATFLCFGLGLTLVLHMALARMLGSDAAYGELAYYRSISMMIALVATLGLPSLLLRQIASRRIHAEQHASLQQETVAIFRLQFMAMLALVVLSAVLAATVIPATERALTCACVVVGLASAWQMTGEQMGRGLKQFVFSQFAFRVLCPAFALLAAYTWWILAGSLSPLDALVVLAGSFLLSAGLLLLRAGKTLVALPSELNVDQTRHGDTLVAHALTSRRLLASSLPMLATSGLMLLMSQLDVLMLRPLAGEAITGQYSAAACLAALVSLPLMAINIVSGTYYAERHAMADADSMNRAARRYMRFILPASVVLGVVLIAACPQLLSLFGNEFASARNIVCVLILGQWINSASGSSATLLCMTGEERACMVIFGCGAVLNGILNGVLIPAYGAVGAATATATSLAFWNIGAILWMRYTTGVDTSVLNFLWPPRAGMRNALHPIACRT